MARPPSPLTAFIRSLPLDLPVKEVIEKARTAGHETSESNVSRVRADMAKATPKKSASKPISMSKHAASPKKSARKKGTAPKDTTAPGTAKSAGVSKSEFIRLHPSLSAAEVIAAGKDQGLSFTSSLVYSVRGAKAGKATSKKAASKKAPARRTAAKKTSTTSSATATPKKTATSAKTASNKTATSSKPGETKADFVRARSHLSPKEIVEDAKTHGIKLDPSYVHNMRGYDKATASKNRRAASKKSTATTVAKRATAISKESPKPTTSNGKRPSGSASSVEELLRAVAAEIGLGRAMEILAGERAKVRAVMGA